MPLEALADDENLAALEAGQEGDVVLDSADLDSPNVKPKKKGKAKTKAPPTQASKKASAEDASAFSSMQVCMVYPSLACLFIEPVSGASGVISSAAAWPVNLQDTFCAAGDAFGVSSLLPALWHLVEHALGDFFWPCAALGTRGAGEGGGQQRVWQAVRCVWRRPGGLAGLCCRYDAPPH